MSRTVMSWVLAALVLSIAFAAGCAPTISNPPEYAERPISAEAGATYFAETGGGDPYATGMAFPVFLALMELYPDELGRDMPTFTERFGFYWPPDKKDDPRALPVGLHTTTDPNTTVAWLVGNCTVCHAERLRLPSGDVMVTGLGNKRVRPHEYQNALIRIGLSNINEDTIASVALRRAQERGLSWPLEMRGPVIHATVEGLRAFARARKQELPMWKDAVPGRMATIEAFGLGLNRAQKEQITFAPVVGYAKVPDVRSFPFRDTFSYDASGFGSPQALTLEADFLFGARPEWFVSHPHIATSVYLYLRSFTRKLPYPGPIDAELSERGHASFERACASCHGHYVREQDGEMRVSYKERVIPKEIVGTDPARVDAVTPSFVASANAFPLSRGYTAVRNTGGYVPPVLLDVWARGVLGHVGQWPSIAALAQPEASRPKKFIVDTNGLYDLERLGVRYEEGGDRALRTGEYLYDGTKPGYYVTGHPYLASLPEEERRAVLEYVKTL